MFLIPKLLQRRSCRLASDSKTCTKQSSLAACLADQRQTKGGIIWVFQRSSISMPSCATYCAGVDTANHRQCAVLAAFGHTNRRALGQGMASLGIVQCASHRALRQQRHSRCPIACRSGGKRLLPLCGSGSSLRSGFFSAPYKNCTPCTMCSGTNAHRHWNPNSPFCRAREAAGLQDCYLEDNLALNKMLVVLQALEPLAWCLINFSNGSLSNRFSLLVGAI